MLEYLPTSKFQACIVSSKTDSLTHIFLYKALPPLDKSCTSINSITKPSKPDNCQSSLLKMMSLKLLNLFTLALLPLSFAAPASSPEPLSADTAAIQWIPIDFNGKTLYLNSAAVAVSANPAEGAKLALLNGNAPDSDTCDGTTLDPHPAPFANTADCAVIRDCKPPRT
jgi:hypothetical protein